MFWEPGGDEITLTMKLKRKPVTQKYAADIAELYAAQPGSTVHEPKPQSHEAAVPISPALPKLLGRMSLVGVLARVPVDEAGLPRSLLVGNRCGQHRLSRRPIQDGARATCRLGHTGTLAVSRERQRWAAPGPVRALTDFAVQCGCSELLPCLTAPGSAQATSRPNSPASHRGGGSTGVGFPR